MKYTVLALLASLICLFAAGQQKISIIKIQALSRVHVDSANGKLRILKIDCYLVRGYRNNKINGDYIDRFVKTHKDPQLNRYSDYDIFFYQKSAKTNIDTINHEIKSTGKYLDNEDDLVLDYTWHNGRGFERHILDSGTEVHQPIEGYKRISIIPLTMLNSTDTIKDANKITMERSDYFLVRGYHDNKVNSEYIDRFAKKYRYFKLREYEEYRMIFYMETAETNLKTIKQYVKIKDKNYQNNSDLIYQFNWAFGKFSGEYKYRDGRIIKPKSTVSFKSIPIPADTIKK